MERIELLPSIRALAFALENEQQIAALFSSLSLSLVENPAATRRPLKEALHEIIQKRIPTQLILEINDRFLQSSLSDFLILLGEILEDNWDADKSACEQQAPHKNETTDGFDSRATPASHRTVKWEISPS